DFTSYYFVYQLGIPGNTTRDVLNRVRAECEARAPHVVIFAAGINDASGISTPDIPRADLTSLESNVRQIIRISRQFTDAILWVGLTHVDESRTTPFTGIYFASARVKDYDEILARICVDEGSIFLPVDTILTVSDLEDGLHPNAEGHRKLCAAIYDKLQMEKML
ncbi:MAG: hypothetical protein G01um101466_181, partial [Parcubacteria group bacterium Gr01-1014_66]